MEAMESHDWVHLACHGSQNPNDPSHSAFHLYDGGLTLAEITKRGFSNKGFTFLPACQTATGDSKMPDEAVHLAAGMLTTGYPSMIATMWSIHDEDGPEVASKIYEELLDDGKMDHTGAAKVLHEAVTSLWEKVGVENVDRWARFIHMGS
jgi:CHAT domain-containing protein